MTKTPTNTQHDQFRPLLSDIIDMKHLSCCFAVRWIWRMRKVRFPPPGGRLPPGEYRMTELISGETVFPEPQTVANGDPIALTLQPQQVALLRLVRQ